MTTVETVFEDTAESLLMEEDQRRNLSKRALTKRSLVRFLEPEEGGLPNGCSVIEGGTSDNQCKMLSNGKFSYKCANNGYVCCRKKQVAGKCD